MHGSNENVHQDVIRIIASSERSFDDAVKKGIQELKKGKFHRDLEFVSYEVVQFQGTIQDDKDLDLCEAKLFQVVLDVAGVHKHEDKK